VPKGVSTQHGFTAVENASKPERTPGKSKRAGGRWNIKTKLSPGDFGGEEASRRHHVPNDRVYKGIGAESKAPKKP